MRAARPDVRSRAVMWNARQVTLVTYALIAVNVAVFVWITAGDSGSLGSGQISERQVDLGLWEPFLAAEGEWYRLVTAGFLHFGLIHIGFNMLLLYQLGQLLEPAVGRVRFGLMYLAALLGGSAGALLLEPNSLSGGASGAVFGLMGAAAVGLRQRGINPFSTGLGSVLLINLLITFSVDGISIGGHVGGLIAGGVCALVVLAPQWRYPTWTTYAVPIAVSALAVAVSWAAVEL